MFKQSKKGYNQKRRHPDAPEPKPNVILADKVGNRSASGKHSTLAAYSPKNFIKPRVYANTMNKNNHLF